MGIFMSADWNVSLLPLGKAPWVLVNSEVEEFMI